MAFTFDETNTFRNVGIGTTNNKIIIMNVSKSSDNLSFHSTTNDTSVDIMSIKTILNKDDKNDLNISAFDGNTINPIIQINNTNQHININSNLNINSNVNIIIPGINRHNDSNDKDTIYITTGQTTWDGFDQTDIFTPLAEIKSKKDSKIILHGEGGSELDIDLDGKLNCTSFNIKKHNTGTVYSTMSSISGEGEATFTKNITLNTDSSSNNNELKLKTSATNDNITSKIVFERGDSNIYTQIFNRRVSNTVHRTVMYSRNNIEFMVSDSTSDIYSNSDKTQLLIYSDHNDNNGKAVDIKGDTTIDGKLNINDKFNGTTYTSLIQLDVTQQDISGTNTIIPRMIIGNSDVHFDMQLYDDGWTRLRRANSDIIALTKNQIYLNKPTDIDGTLSAKNTTINGNITINGQFKNSYIDVSRQTNYNVLTSNTDDIYITSGTGWPGHNTSEHTPICEFKSESNGRVVMHSTNSDCELHVDGSIYSSKLDVARGGTTGDIETNGFCYQASTGVTYVGFDSGTKNNRIPHEGGNFSNIYNRVHYGDNTTINNTDRNMHTAFKICHADAGKNGAGWHIGLPIAYPNTGEHEPDEGGGTNLFFAVQFKNGNIRYAGWLRSNNATGQNTPIEMNFTGQHRCVPNNINYYNNVDNFIGLIVYATGDYKTYDTINDILYSDNNAITINNSLPIIELTNIKKEPAVFGIISNKEEENRNYCAGNFVTPISNLNDEKRLYINSVGEGAIWIVNTNGNLKNGDYIQSSDILGIGERQDDDILHNYTVAKITCNCNFDINSSKYKCESFIDSTSGNTYLKAFVGCTYHCG